MTLPAWKRPTRGEHRWPAALALLAVIALQLVLPRNLTFSPQWLPPAVEGLLVVVLMALNPARINRESRLLRLLGLALIAVVSVATAWSAALLVRLVLHESAVDAPTLLLNGGAIWLTNVIVFAIWYWEADRGGPAARALARKEFPDFLFTGMTSSQFVPPHWEPTFVDYLYLSFTNATAFSPTDTMPMSRWAKVTMLVESLISLAMAALVIARAINILS